MSRGHVVILVLIPFCLNTLSGLLVSSAEKVYSDCSSPTHVEHSSIHTSNGTRFNSIVTYLCNEGYVSTTKQTLRCGENGKWTGSLPTCNPVDCSSPKHVEHSSIHTSNSTRFNSIVTYLCNEGYVPTSKQTLRCGENGNWTGSLPTCNPVDCGNPPNVTNGKASLISRSTTYLSQASYTCDNGFVLYGGNIPIQCQANGIWDENTPTCWKISNGYNEPCVGLNFTNECSTTYAECRPGISRRQSDLRCLCIHMFEFDQYNNYCRPTLPENIQCSVVDVRDDRLQLRMFPNCTTGSPRQHFSTYIIHFNQSRSEVRRTCQTPEKTFYSLTPASPYTVQVQVEEGGFKSREVECASGYTRPSAPDILSVSNIGESSFSISWGYESYKPPQGFLYRLLVKPTEQPVITPNTSHVVSNLRSDTSYTVTVIGIINGTTESVEKNSFGCTLPDPPNIIFNGEKREDNGVSLNISSDTGIARIFIGGKQCDVSSYKRFCTISGLGQGQSYDITAQTFTYTCNKWSRNGPTITVSTRPGEPTNLVIHNKTETTLCVKWLPPRSGGVDNYIVNLKQEDIKTKSNDTSYCFDSLDPGSEYTVIVRSEWNKLKSLDVTQLDTSTVPLPPAVSIVHVGEMAATVNVANFNKSLSCELVLDNTSPIQLTAFQQEIKHQTLLPGTRHQVKARCSFDGNRFFSQYSKAVSFRLVPGMVRDISVNVSATTESFLSIYWTAPYGKFDRFTVSLDCKSPNKKKQSRNAFRQRGVKDDGIANVSSYSYNTADTIITQKELDPGTSCTANVTSHMEEMAGNPVVKELLQTTQESAPEHVQNLQVKYYSTTTMAITWSSSDIPNGVIRRYLVDITATDCTCCAPRRTLLQCQPQISATSQEPCTDKYLGLSGNPNLTVLCTDDNVRYEATGLNPGRNYGVSIAAYTMCWGPTATIQQTTKETEPSSPPTIIEVSATDQGVLVRWHPPACEEANGRITHYVVRHNVYTARCIGETQGGSTTQDKIFNTTKTSVNVTDLMAHKEYRIEVAAATRVGTGPYSRYRSVTAKETIPGAVDPRSINAYDIYVNNFTVYWSIPCYTNGNITSYIVRIYSIDTNSLVNERNTSHRQMLVSNLLPYSNHTVSVAAVNTFGHGPYTNSTSVTTRVAAPYPVDHLKPLDIQPTSLKIGWKKPSLYTGPTQYNITVHDLYSKTSTLTVVYGFHNEEYTVSKLKPFWNYTVSIGTITSAGVSETKHISTTTSEHFPGPVQGLRATSMDDILQPRSVIVTWEALDVGQRNGVLQRYHVRHAVSGKNEGHMAVSPTENKLTIYNVATGQVEIQVTAETNPGEGQPVNTSVNVPVGAPLKIDESKQLLMTSSDASVTDKLTQIAVQLPVQQFLCNHSNGKTVSWGVIVAEASRAKDEPFFGMKADFEKRRYKTWFDFRDTGVAEPYIATDQKWNPCVPKSRNNDRRRRSVPENEQSVFLVGVDGECSGKLPPDVCNGQLKHGQEYRVRSFACTSAGCTETEYSKPIKTDAARYISIVVVSLAATFSVLLGIVILIMKKRQTGCFGMTSIHFIYRQSEQATEMTTTVSVEALLQPIKTVDLPRHVDMLHNEGLFPQIFQIMERNSANGTTTYADKRCNRKKNKANGIRPYDQYRVQLSYITGCDGSDYINASFIPGYKSDRTYIATQDPMKTTMGDFWRMVLEQNVATIVMMSTHDEKETVDQYWPDLGKTMRYDQVVVSNESETLLDNCTVRILRLKLASRKLTVYQFVLQNWTAVRSNSKILLNFVQSIRQDIGSDTPDLSPIVVHCSDGCGASGTFIAVDHLLQHIRDHDDVDIYNMVLDMRQHRCKMVQTEEQLMCIYKCLKEHSLCLNVTGANVYERVDPSVVTEEADKEYQELIF